ncbi:Aste57867_17511 [Aphanomyces stellatus]|uniref:Aste57867_17511 protein n=1 Tax=Aphanomyces stellatus TaxID=120398 RepID=A0A485L8P0_9STRA|nr:hypothetical protein As57867_017451 [Aphanomyces stellatus]VFT94264.1 Aste57867_17511 [Aphanomyces stellatus]
MSDTRKRNAVKKHSAAYRMKNREMLRLKNREWKVQNKDRVAAQKAAYREKNRERIRAHDREYYYKKTGKMPSSEDAHGMADSAAPILPPCLPPPSFSTYMNPPLPPEPLGHRPREPSIAVSASHHGDRFDLPPPLPPSDYPISDILSNRPPAAAAAARDGSLAPPGDACSTTSSSSVKAKPRKRNMDKQAEYDRAYRERNKAKLAQKSRAYYQTYKDRVLTYKALNREKVLATTREWKERNKERVQVQRKAYREANIERIREHDRKMYRAKKDKAVLDANKAGGIPHEATCAPTTKSPAAPTYVEV